METLRGAGFFPRRLTQLFADTKKSYENVVQTETQSPQLSSLHLSLRIQKDRLLAWGMEWSDATASQSMDIDVSLDRAGISDLVASIMGTIRDLLDEAEGLLSVSETNRSPVYGDTKAPVRRTPSSSLGPESITRLERILVDLTTSIDTLCDLSRPKIEDQKDRPSGPKLEDPFSRAGFHTLKAESSYSKNAKVPSKYQPAFTLDVIKDHGLIASSKIHPTRIRPHLSAMPRSGSLPPSYESVAAGLDNRTLAYLSPIDGDEQLPILLDYGQKQSGDLKSRSREPDHGRYEEMCMALARLSSTMEDAYSGLLSLKGWTDDSDQARCAYVYEVPQPNRKEPSQGAGLQPRSLLSFLQNGADTDGANMPSLENRFRLALNASRSLHRLHAVHVLHRSFNSNNIVFFIDERSLTANNKVWKGPIIRKPYLVGFLQKPSEPSDEIDSDFATMYHHPQLGNKGGGPYLTSHDYYSLGLVLLEIGLWMPLGKFWKSKYTRDDFKMRLQNIYLRKLSAKCGTLYMKAVLFCLTAAEVKLGGGTPYTSQGSAEDDEEQRFLKVVIGSLEKCCMLDPETEASHSKTFLNSADTLVERQALVTASSGPSDLKSALKEPSSNINQSHRNKSAEKDTRDLESAVSSPKKIKIWSHDVPSLYTDYWTSTMLPKLEHILSRAINRWESYSIDLFMAGEESDVARPTIYFECSSTEKVRKILRFLNKDLRLFDIKVVSGHIVRSKAKKQKKKSKRKPASSAARQAEGSMDGTQDLQRLNPHYQKIPSCGASIGACIDGKHLPPVTFGGTILVDGETYGMSVHHMLEDDDELELGIGDHFDFQRSMASREPQNLEILDSPYASDRVDDSDHISDNSSLTGFDYPDEYTNLDTLDLDSPQPIYPFELLEDEPPSPHSSQATSASEDDEFWLSPDFSFHPKSPIAEDSDDENMELGDTPGIPADKGHHLAVTQPAIDDVSHRFFSDPGAASEEHLLSHAFGHIHATSGLRRSRKDGVIHEIDWALIKIKEERLQDQNSVPGAAQIVQAEYQKSQAKSRPGFPTTPILQSDSGSHSYPTHILPSTSLPNLRVHCRGRTSGLQTGVILPTMRLIRLPGRAFASHSWHVRGNFGEGGDSGAWVMGNETGGVAGCVLAYGSRTGEAYLEPMDILVGDLERCFGKTGGGKVHLPFCRDTTTAGAERAGTRSPEVVTSPPMLTHELSQLSLDDVSAQAKGIQVPAGVKRASAKGFEGKDRMMVQERDMGVGTVEQYRNTQGRVQV